MLGEEGLRVGPWRTCGHEGLVLPFESDKEDYLTHVRCIEIFLALDYNMHPAL